MKRRWIVSATLLALIVAAGCVLLLTSAGLNWIVAIAAPGSVEFERLEGRAIGPVRVTGLRWQDSDRQLTIGAASVDWKLLPLLERHVHLTSVDAEGLRWQAASRPGPAPDQSAGLPELPVRISVDALHLRDIAIVQDDSALTIDLLRLSATLDSGRYRVAGIELRSPALDVSGEAAVGANAPHPLDVDLTWAARLGADPIRIAGSVRADGNTDSLKLQIGTEDALELSLVGKAENLLSAPAFDGELELARIDPRLSGLNDEGLALSLELSASPQSLQLDGLVRAPSLSPKPATVSAAVNLDGEQIAIERLETGFAETPARLQVTGTVRRDLTALDVSMNWRQIDWPLTGAPVVTSPVGRASLSGALDRYALDLDASVSAPQWPATQIALQGTGDRQRFEIASATVRPGDRRAANTPREERLSAFGTLEWGAIPAADLKYNARALDLQRLHPILVGELDADGRVQASIPETGAEVAISLLRLGGQLRGQKLGGSGAVNIVPGSIGLRNIALTVGKARIATSGTVAQRLDLQWDVEIPDLGLLLPPYGGAIRSSGRASGPSARPGLVGNLDVRMLDASPVAIERLSGRVDVGLAATANAQIELDGTGVRFDKLDVGAVTVKADGTIAAQTVRVDIAGPLATLALQLSGRLDATAWQGQIDALTVERAGLGEWRLREPAGLGIDTQSLTVDNACFARDDALACIDGALARNAPARADVVIESLPVAMLAPLLPPGLEYEGNIDGNGSFTGTPGNFDGEASLRLDAGRVLTRESGEENIMLGYENGRLQARFDATALQAEAHFDLRGDGVVDATVRAPWRSEEALEGNVTVRIENLSIVPALVPQIGRIDGTLQANLDLAGTTRAPEASGRIGVDASELVLPDFGITLEDSRIDVATAANELSFDGEATSGEGSLAIDGTLRWFEGVPVGRLRLSGESFRAVDLPEISIDASPQITVGVERREITVAGEVTVPTARITPLNIATGVSVSPDQIIVDEAVAAAPEDRWEVDATLRVTAGDDVQISGFGLKGRLAGSVLIVQQPGQPATGRGTLEVVDGRYRAYGQELTINTGRLEFTGGPIDDPGLDLRASRQAEDIEAGVQVRGALRRPTLTLYSSPPLSDTETLSYLVTGRGIEQLDEQGQTAVSDAATRLALQSGGSLLAKSVGRGLGLDTVAFEDEGTTASTSLVVGKQLSPRLFVSYGIGLFEAINTLRLRYRINPRLTLETESGPTTSADLLYSFDR